MKALLQKPNRKGGLKLESKKRYMGNLREEKKDNVLNKEEKHFNAAATHSCGGSNLLRYNLQRIDH